MVPDSVALSAASPDEHFAAQTAASTATSTPWPGPGPRPTATPTLPPTSLATSVLAETGFPPGFLPTPRPTRELVTISLPYVYPIGGSAVDVPVINQVYYPEPFFPPGTNNACGPVALFAGLLGLGFEVDYGHLRNIAVNNGFTAQGISKWGMINTLITLNNEWGNPLAIEHGNFYSPKDLIRQLRQGGVIVVLVRVTRVNGQYQVTSHKEGSIGHFLLVERINLRSNKVKLAGSTLGMDEVPLSDFIQSWASNPETVSSDGGWRSFLKNEQDVNWALILKRA